MYLVVLYYYEFSQIFCKNLFQVLAVFKPFSIIFWQLFGVFDKKNKKNKSKTYSINVYQCLNLLDLSPDPAFRVLNSIPGTFPGIEFSIHSIAKSPPL